jgi:S-adenosylmethionine:tRNA ribosyltransferase-isomerase
MPPDSHSLDLYDYDLPPELVAQDPLPDRAASRLLVLDRARGGVAHRNFRDLPQLLAAGDLLVLNRSRVLPARLLGTRPGGGAAEVLLVRRRGPGIWDALLRPGRRLPPGMLIEVGATLQVRVEEPTTAGRTEGSPPTPLRRVRLLSEDTDPDRAIERYGHMPLPPYIRRADRPTDRERYQTVYARERGSVAAPTAGLHFTSSLLERLKTRGIETAELVLHVGPGTFRPVEVDDVRDHRVDPEVFTIPPETAAAVNRARREGRRVVAVGTTTTRTLEGALGPGGGLPSGDGETDLVITPGHRFRAVNALITNFHLPRSSLLLLVSAFAGRERTLAAYSEAVRHRYRFYSYGDASLIL